jgi:hypothetical protein
MEVPATASLFEIKQYLMSDNISPTTTVQIRE